MTILRNDAPGMGSPAASKEVTQGLQRPEGYHQNRPQEYWKRRAIRQYQAGRLGLLEVRRIFASHLEEFSPGGVR